MRINTAMKALLKGTDFTGSLSQSLTDIAVQGFELVDECYVLRALASKAQNAPRTRFHDCTGYECFVNSLHVEDYDDKDPLVQSILFMECVLRAWNSSMPSIQLIGIVSADEFSVVVRFHINRPTEQWLSDNIEGYEDPIMACESSDNILTELALIR